MTFSREHIFSESFVAKKHLLISFKHDSKAYKDYGDCESFSAIYTDEEIEEMIVNYRAGKNTSGIVKGEIVLGKATVEQKERMKNVGFHSDDILEILPPS